MSWKKLSIIKPMMNSSADVSTMLPRNSSGKLSFTGSSSHSTSATPKPYIGHTGPLRKPRLTNIPRRQAANTTSAHQPRNE